MRANMSHPLNRGLVLWGMGPDAPQGRKWSLAPPSIGVEATSSGISEADYSPGPLPFTEGVQLGTSGDNIQWQGSFMDRGPVSLSCWVRQTGSGGSHRIVSNNARVLLRGSSSSLRNIVFFGDGSSGDVTVTSDDYALDDNVWTHVFCTWNGVFGGSADAFIYRNGQDWTKTINRPGGTDNKSMSYWSIGRPGSTTLAAQVSDLRVFDRMLSPDEVLNQYLASCGGYRGMLQTNMYTVSGTTAAATSTQVIKLRDKGHA